MRQLAWLNTDRIDGKGRSLGSRLSEYRQAGNQPPMPAVVVSGHLISWLFDVGPANGQRAIGYADLDAWLRVTGIDATAWECQTLRILSAEYISQAFDARALDCPIPWEPEGVDNRQVVTSKVQNAFRSLMRKRA